MTNQISFFECQDTFLIILQAAAEGNSSELLKNRLVNKLWKNHSDYLIERLWMTLHQLALRGAVDIVLAIDTINATKIPIVIKFEKLMNVFKKQGCSFNKSSPVLLMANDFQKLQQDLALLQIWPRLRQNNKISALAELPDLDATAAEVRTFLHNNQITLETFRELRLDNLGLKSLPPELKLFKGLSRLNLNDNQLSDVSDLASLINLKGLWLESNQLSDISHLATLTNLTMLALRNNQLSDVSDLASLINLKGLWLENNQLSDISHLAALTNLTHLWLNNNQLSDVFHLTGLTNLTKLGLSSNQLSDISHLATLTNLTHLWVHNNPLTDVSCLASLTKLMELKVNNNL